MYGTIHQIIYTSKNKVSIANNFLYPSEISPKIPYEMTDSSFDNQGDDC